MSDLAIPVLQRSSAVTERSREILLAPYSVARARARAARDAAAIVTHDQLEAIREAEGLDAAVEFIALCAGCGWLLTDATRCANCVRRAEEATANRAAPVTSPWTRFYGMPDDC